MKKHATIKDIAFQLNVSIATVSRALSGHPNVSKETHARVIEMANKLSYKPNLNAVKLKKQRTYTIGIVIPELKTTFFLGIIAGIEKILHEAGYQLIITQSDESAIKEEKNLRFLESSMVEGILLSVTKEGDNVNLYNDITTSGIPIVFFNRACKLINSSKVILDDYITSFFATEHLIYNKFNRIFHFAGPPNLMVSKEREKGFINAMKKHNRDYSNSVIISGLLSETSYVKMKELISKSFELPDAIFCFSDPTAYGILKAMKEVGLKCPEDIALVGFSETEFSELIEPPLTSIKQPTFEIGESAAKLLIEQINNVNFQPETIRFRGEMNVRESSYNVRY